MAAEPPGLQTLLGMGLVVGATVAIGTVLGLVIDSLLNTVPVFTLIGLAVGIGLAVAYAIVMFRRFLIK